MDGPVADAGWNSAIRRVSQIHTEASGPLEGEDQTLPRTERFFPVAPSPVVSLRRQGDTSQKDTQSWLVGSYAYCWRVVCLVAKDLLEKVT